jgi:hypothetical protein
MPKRMVTLKLDPDRVSVDGVRKKLGLEPAQIDESFGVIDVSPGEHLYAVLVDEEVADAVDGKPGVEGSFSNPKIEPFDAPGG